MMRKPEKMHRVRVRVPMTDSLRHRVPAGGVATLHPSAAAAAISRGDATPYDEAVPPGPSVSRTPKLADTTSAEPDRSRVATTRRTTEGGAARETTDTGALVDEERLPPAPVDLSKLSKQEALNTIRSCDNRTLLAKWAADLEGDRPYGYKGMLRAIEDRYSELDSQG